MATDLTEYIFFDSLFGFDNAQGKEKTSHLFFSTCHGRKFMKPSENIRKHKKTSCDCSMKRMNDNLKVAFSGKGSGSSRISQKYYTYNKADIF